MTATPTAQKRLAFFCTPTRTRVNWIDIDQTGQPPRIIRSLDGQETARPFDLVSLDDAPIAVYRYDEHEGYYDRDALAALAELVRVVNGMPNVSADVDEQMRQLREQLRATVDNATDTFNKYEARIAYDERRIEKIIEQARAWKAAASDATDVAERRNAEHASTLADLRASRRMIDELEAKLRVARLAVERAVNRSNHSAEHVADARARQDAAKVAADGYRDEAESLRQQLGQATAEAHDLRERIVEVQANALETINRVAAALPEPVIAAEVVTPDVVVDTWFGEDNVPVVQIDTEDGHGRLRINLNDGVVWDGDPETDERPGAHAEPEEFSREAARIADGATISRQLDTIRAQTEKIERLENECDELVQALKNRNGEGDPADPGAHGGAIPSYGMLDLWQAIRGDAGAGFEEWYDSLGYAEAWSALLVKVRLLRTDLIGARELGARLQAERDSARADAEKLREINELQRGGIDDSERSRRDALQQRDDLDRKLTESETMRRRLDERLANERRVYETTSAALRAMIRERDAVLDVAERAIYPHAHGETKARLIGEYRDARGRLPKLEPEADARDGGLVDVIRQYDGLAQIGANLARAVIESVNLERGMVLPERFQIAEHYQREHAKLKR